MSVPIRKKIGGWLGKTDPFFQFSFQMLSFSQLLTQHRNGCAYTLVYFCVCLNKWIPGDFKIWCNYLFAVSVSQCHPKLLYKGTSKKEKKIKYEALGNKFSFTNLDFFLKFATLYWNAYLILPAPSCSLDIAQHIFYCCEILTVPLIP